MFRSIRESIDNRNNPTAKKTDNNVSRCIEITSPLYAVTTSAEPRRKVQVDVVTKFNAGLQLSHFDLALA